MRTRGRLRRLAEEAQGETPDGGEREARMVLAASSLHSFGKER